MGHANCKASVVGLAFICPSSKAAPTPEDLPGIYLRERMRRGFLVRPPKPKAPPPPTRLTHPTLNVPQLPPELTDRILDHLHDDKRTIEKCSHVCKSWLPRARFHYFSRVKIDSKKCGKFENILDNNPIIGSCVKELQITTYMTEGSDWIRDCIPRMGQKLTAVTHLILSGDGSYMAQPFRYFTSVRDLRMMACEIPSITEFALLICTLPSLESLSCNNVLVDGDSAAIQKPPITLPRPPIKKLEFLATRLDPGLFTEWMMEEGMHRFVEEVVIRPLQKFHLIAVGKFLTACGATLKRFEIAMVALRLHGGYNDVIGPFFSLAQCTDLRALEFGSPAGYAVRYGTDDTSFNWVSGMLAQVTSPKIEEITFWLSRGDIRGLDSDEWKHIAALLQSQQFASLKRVRMRIWGTEANIDRVKTIVRGQLQDLCERRILQFDENVSENGFPQTENSLP